MCDTFGAWCKEFRQKSFWYTYICSYNHIEHLLKTVIINEWIEMQLGGKHNMILHKKKECFSVYFLICIQKSFLFCELEVKNIFANLNQMIELFSLM